jgi:hypothetical protein
MCRRGCIHTITWIRCRVGRERNRIAAALAGHRAVRCRNPCGLLGFRSRAIASVYHGHKCLWIIDSRHVFLRDGKASPRHRNGHTFHRKVLPPAAPPVLAHITRRVTTFEHTTVPAQPHQKATSGASLADVFRACRHSAGKPSGKTSCSHSGTIRLRPAGSRHAPYRVAREHPGEVPGAMLNIHALLTAF